MRSELRAINLISLWKKYAQLHVQLQEKKCVFPTDISYSWSQCQRLVQW
jgi:hypothetical protein